MDKALRFHLDQNATNTSKCSSVKSASLVASSATSCRRSFTAVFIARFAFKFRPIHFRILPLRKAVRAISGFRTSRSRDQIYNACSTLKLIETLSQISLSETLENKYLQSAVKVILASIMLRKLVAHIRGAIMVSPDSYKERRIRSLVEREALVLAVLCRPQIPKCTV